MSGACSSSPTSGCTDSQTLISLDSYTEMVTLKLGELVVKKGQIVTDITNCRNTINALWQEVLDKMETYKDNRSDCCERLGDLLDDINTELDDKTNPPHPVTPTTTEEPTPTTTEEPVVTTTEEPTPTTTEGPVYNHGLFNYEDDADFLCLEENVMTLYYQGIIEIGTVLFTDQGTTPFNAGDYVKRAGAVVKYAVNGSGVITSQLAQLCE
jgi:hypothetical protein